MHLDVADIFRSIKYNQHIALKFHIGVKIICGIK